MIGTIRPETVESLFIAFRLTGDPKYREWGWGIFRAIETHCRIESGGYASILNVDHVPVEHEDKMETFLMASHLRRVFPLFSSPDGCWHRVRRSNICTYFSMTTAPCRYQVRTAHSLRSLGTDLTDTARIRVQHGGEGFASSCCSRVLTMRIQAHPLPIFNPTIRTGFS